MPAARDPELGKPRRVRRREPTFTIDALRDPETIVAVLAELGWHRVVDDHTPDCPAGFDSGNRCNCVPDAPTWAAPQAVYDFLGEDWESRLRFARARKNEV